MSNSYATGKPVWQIDVIKFLMEPEFRDLEQSLLSCVLSFALEGTWREVRRNVCFEVGSTVRVRLHEQILRHGGASLP